MGYTTEFKGGFIFDKLLDKDTNKLLDGLATTRRMARNVDPKYGVDGEFYVDGPGFYGQDHTEDIITYNDPPRTQPGLWCQWEVRRLTLKSGKEVDVLVWNEGEKFYHYISWLNYLIEKVIAPAGYILNGEAIWFGEEVNDIGVITITNNNIKVINGETKETRTIEDIAEEQQGGGQ
jgi:hypothetical protein